MKGPKALTEGALFAAIFIVLLLMTVFIPFVGLISTFILPIPLIVYASRYGWKSSFVLFGVCLIGSLLFATIFSLPLTLLVGFGGLAIGISIYKNKTPYETWVRGTVGYVLGLLFVFVITQVLFQVNWTEEMNQIMEESLNLSQQITQSIGGSVGSEELEMMKEQLRRLPYLIPSGIAIIAIVLAFISQWFSYKVINRIQQEKLFFPPFRELTFPTSVLWYYFIAVIVMWIQPELESIVYQGAINIYILAGALILVQGYSFILEYAYQKKLSKPVPVIVIVLTLLFPIILLYPVRILGIIDIGFSLRDRIKNKEK